MKPYPLFPYTKLPALMVKGMNTTKNMQYEESPYLCEAFNHTNATGAIPRESLDALVVTIPKPGQTPGTPANFRPIPFLILRLKYLLNASPPDFHCLSLNWYT